MRYNLSCHQIRFFHLLLILAVLTILTAGCATGGKPQYEVEKFLLHYPAPSWEKPVKLAASVKLNRFSIAAAYNTTGMIFRKDDGYGIDAFNYSRWAVNPADMIADRLLDDMRGSSLFQGVFSRHETDAGQFALSGGIEEFYLRLDKNDKTARVAMTILLQNTREKETGKRIMYQKKYTRESPLRNSSPAGYCEAASLAMQSISGEIISDVYAAVEKRAEKIMDAP